MSDLSSRRWRALACASLAFGAVPIIVVPTAGAAGRAELQSSPARAIDGKIVAGLSTERSVTYATEKGYVTRLFGRPINVKDDKGVWQRIDNTLRPAAGGGFENGLGSFDLSIPQSLAAPVKLSHEGAELSLNLRGSDAQAKISGASATFAGAGEKVSAKLTANNEALKEDLVLADASAQTTFVYDLGLSGGLSPVERPDGGLNIVDKSGDVEFTAAAPVAADSKGDLAPKSATSLKVSKDAGGWVLTLSLDKNWLGEPGRAMPVTLDPSFALGATRDCFTDQQDATTNFCGSGELWAGRAGAGHNHNALTYFNVAGTVPAGSLVQRASLVLYPLYQTSPGTAKTLAAREVTTDWDNNATWTKRTAAANWTTGGGDLATTDLSTQPLPASGAFSAFTVTDAVSSWVAGKSVNRGLAVTDNGSTVNNTQVYASADWSDSSKWPSLEIEYQGRLGAQSTYTIDKQQITDRQSVGVNVAGGNLLLESTDLQVPGTGLPLNVKRTYNSQEPWDGQLGTGGARISLGEDVKLYTCDDAGSKCLISAGGTRSVFKYNVTTGAYATPPGIGNVSLTKQTTGSLNFILTDNKSGVKIQFFNASFSFMNRIEDKNGNAITLEQLGTLGNLSKITDTHGRQYPVSLNSAGYVTKIEVPTSVLAGGLSWNYGYNAYNFLTSVTDPEGKTTSYGYASNDKINRVTDPRGNDTLITYDTALRVTSVTRKVDGTTTNDVTTTYAYPAITSACDKAPATPDPDVVGMTEVTDPNAHKTTYCWNSEGVVLRAKDALGRTVTTTYTPEGNVASFADLGGTSSPYATTAYTYGSGSGSASSPTRIDAPAGEKTDIAYGSVPATPPAADLFKWAQPTDTTDEQGDKTKFTYDDASRTNITKIENERGANTTLSTDLVWDPTNKSRLASSTDKAGHLTSYAYTGGNLTTVTPHNSTIIGATEYVYDGISRVTRSKDGRAGQWVDYTYDKVGRQLTVPDSDGLSSSVTYDANGNVVSRTAAGKYSSYVYDNLGRKTSETLNGATTTYIYDKLGNLKTLTDASGTVTYAYDASDRLIKITSPTATSGTDDTTYAYTDPLSPTGLGTVKSTLPGAGTITQSTDTSGKLRQVLVKNASATQTFKQDWAYVGDRADGGATTDSLGNLQSTTRQNGGTGATATTTAYGYKVGAQLQTATTGTSVTTLDYDPAGNRKSKVITASGSTTANTTYAYNDVNELCWQRTTTAAVTPTCAVPPSGATSYTYDKAGNQLTGGVNTTWDAKGRIDGVGSVYSSILSPNNNELVGIGSDSYTNTALGVSRISVGGNLTKLVRNTSGGTVSQIRDSTKRWFVTDQLGSTTALLDSTGTVARSYDYDIDGNDTTTGTGPATWIKYAGGHDVGNGLYHYGARYYQPSSARWTQMDPLLQPSDLGQANRYNYVAGNPINATDPAGLCAAHLDSDPSCNGPLESRPQVRRKKAPGKGLSTGQKIGCAGAVGAATAGGIAAVATGGLSVPVEVGLITLLGGGGAAGGAACTL